MNQNKYHELISPYILSQSEINQRIGKHVCIILQGRKVLSVGYSNNNRTYFCGIEISSLHSEMDAIKSLLTVRERNLIQGFCSFPTSLNKMEYKSEHKIYPVVSENRKKWKKRTALIVKVSFPFSSPEETEGTEGKRGNEFTFSFSKPCLHCAIILSSLGVDKVVYSQMDGSFTKIRLKDETFRPSSCSIMIPRYSKD